MYRNLLKVPSKDQKKSKFVEHHSHFRDILESWRRDGKGPLFSHQVDALLETRACVLAEESDRVKRLLKDETDKQTLPYLIVAPTGSGKTGIIVFLPYILESNKVLIITPSKTITEQIAQAFWQKPSQKCFFDKIKLVPEDASDRIQCLHHYLEKVKVIKNTKEDIRDHLGNLVIVNAQKFGGKSRLSLVYKNQEIIQDVENFFANFDTLIVDEAHHYPAKTWDLICKEFYKSCGSGQRKRIIFLTATPYKIINGEERFILGNGEDAKKRIAYIIDPSKMEGHTTRKCEFYDDGDAGNVLEDIIKILKENKKREPRFEPQAMVLVRKKTEAMDLAAKWNAKSKTGSFAVAVTSDNPDPEILQKFTDGKFQVAITCGIAREGYDNSKVVACIVYRKIVSGRILFQQFVGRCNRIHRNLGGLLIDRSVGIVRSYVKFGARRLWETMNTLAEEDPVEVDEDDEVDVKVEAKSKSCRNTQASIRSPGVSSSRKSPQKASSAKVLGEPMPRKSPRERLSPNSSGELSSRKSPRVAPSAKSLPAASSSKPARDTSSNNSVRKTPSEKSPQKTCASKSEDKPPLIKSHWEKSTAKSLQETMSISSYQTPCRKSQHEKSQDRSFQAPPSQFSSNPVNFSNDKSPNDKMMFHRDSPNNSQSYPRSIPVRSNTRPSKTSTHSSGSYPERGNPGPSQTSKNPQGQSYSTPNFKIEISSKGCSNGHSSSGGRANWQLHSGGHAALLSMSGEHSNGQSYPEQVLRRPFKSKLYYKDSTADESAKRERTT